ncbi:MAG TPA: tetratricopeptide repeat protein [Pyrinomonadaceae bacterium]|jgi:tetratricopeptide (TPR) repeat protein
MEETTAKNVGAVISKPSGPVYQTNIFGGEGPRALPSNIPSARGFIGRKNDLDDLLRAKKSGNRSFVVHGQGGAGKTELALRFIDEIKSEFDARIRVDMRGLDESTLSPHQAVLEVVKMFEPAISAEVSDVEAHNLYLQLLNRHKTLLFLDNAKDRDQLEPLNDSKAFIVSTSRTRFTVSGGFSKEIDEMLPEDARALLFSVAGEERFAGQADGLAYLAGYLPIALLPLASILSEDVTIEVTDLLQKYADRKQLLQLADPNRGNLSVEASFDLSYENLTDELKQYWRKLAVFPGGFDLAAAEAVWETKQGNEIRSQLIKNHLLMFDTETKRSNLHDLARDYAWGKLGRDELMNAQAHHSVHYGSLLASIDSVTLQNLAIFDLERANIEAGFAWVYDKIDINNYFAEICTLYTGYASDLLFLRLSPEEIFYWQKAGLAAYTQLDNLLGCAYSLNNLGRVSRLQGEYEQAIEHYEAAIEIAKREDKFFEAVWLANLANVYFEVKEFKQAINYLTESIEVSINIGNRGLEGCGLGGLGGVHLALGDYDEGISLLESALEIEEIGLRNRGIFLGNLATFYRTTGDNKRFQELSTEALAILHSLKDPEAERLETYWSNWQEED